MLLRPCIVLVLLSFFHNNVLSQTISDVLENAISGVVTVVVEKCEINEKILGFSEKSTRGESDPVSKAYERMLDLSEAYGSGSGFVVDHEGKNYVITNAHVIGDASNEEEAVFVYSINRNKYEVRIVGGDSYFDIAILEFVDEPGDELVPLKMSATPSRIGQSVYAIGNPLGNFPYSVSDGIISGLNRTREGIVGKFGFLQTTATIIWGNSGGPLVNTKGEVVGVNTQIEIEQLDGQLIILPQINFAIEIALVSNIMHDILLTGGFVERAYVGLEIHQITDWLNMGKPVIGAVLEDAPSYELLVKYEGAEILEVQNKKVKHIEDILAVFENYVQANSSFHLKIKQDDIVKEIKVETGLLNTAKLEQLAKNVIEQLEYVEADYSEELLAFTFFEAPGWYSGGYDDDKNKTIRKLSAYDETYYVIAAYVESDVEERLFTIDNLGDFGAAIRIAGIEGQIDFLFESSYYDDPAEVTYYFSGDSDVEQKTLFY